MHCFPVRVVYFYYFGKIECRRCDFVLLKYTLTISALLSYFVVALIRCGYVSSVPFWTQNRQRYHRGIPMRVFD